MLGRLREWRRSFALTKVHSARTRDGEATVLARSGGVATLFITHPQLIDHHKVYLINVISRLIPHDIQQHTIHPYHPSKLVKKIKLCGMVMQMCSRGVAASLHYS